MAKFTFKIIDDFEKSKTVRKFEFEDENYNLEDIFSEVRVFLLGCGYSEASLNKYLLDDGCGGIYSYEDYIKYEMGKVKKEK